MANERQQALIDMLLRIGALLGLIAWCALLLAPFVTIIAWGLIIAVMMLAALLPFFLGLFVVLPVLGHATWHLYRRSMSFAE